LAGQTGGNFALMSAHPLTKIYISVCDREYLFKLFVLNQNEH